MSFFNFLRGLMGMPPDGNSNRPGGFPEERSNEFRNPIWGGDDDDDDDEDFSSIYRRPRGGFFHVDSNPLEIHRFFEKQIEDMMRSFGAFGFGNFGSGNMFSLEPPSMETDPGAFAGPSDPNRGTLREQFLKPGYESDSRSHGGRRMDGDLDDKLPTSELGKILQQGPRLDVIEPERAQPAPGSIMSRAFGRSMTSKTISKPNGGIEHHKSVCDSSGNEEVTVTRTIAGQSYSVTTKIDAQGRKERIENFVNMDESDLKDFEKKWGSKL